MDIELVELSAAIGEACLARKLTIATAESCTGGWAAQVITHTPGSSAWFERGFVTYANAAKCEMLGVSPATLAAFGAVSLETAGEMARGALLHSRASMALAITGIAGPTGGTPEKPAGTVCFAWCLRQQLASAPSCQRRLFTGDRESIRQQAVLTALMGLLDCARNMP